MSKERSTIGYTFSGGQLGEPPARARPRRQAGSSKRRAAALAQMILFGLIVLLVALRGGFISLIFGQLPPLVAYLSLRAWRALRQARTAA